MYYLLKAVSAHEDSSYVHFALLFIIPPYSSRLTEQDSHIHQFANVYSPDRREHNVIS